MKWRANLKWNKPFFFFFFYLLKFHTLVKNLKAGEKVKSQKLTKDLDFVLLTHTLKKSSDSSQRSHK